MSPPIVAVRAMYQQFSYAARRQRLLPHRVRAALGRGGSNWRAGIDGTVGSHWYFAPTSEPLIERRGVAMERAVVGHLHPGQMATIARAVVSSDGSVRGIAQAAAARARGGAAARQDAERRRRFTNACRATRSVGSIGQAVSQRVLQEL